MRNFKIGRICSLILVIGCIHKTAHAQLDTLYACSSSATGTFNLPGLVQSTLGPGQCLSMDISGNSFTTDTLVLIPNYVDSAASVNYMSMNDSIYAFVGTLVGPTCTNGIWTQVQLRVRPFPVIAITENMLCDGEELQMQFGPTGNGPWSMFWNSGPLPASSSLDSLSFTVANTSTAVSGARLDSITDGVGCTTATTDSVFISPLPQIMISEDTLCSGETLVIDLLPTGTAPWNFTWTPAGWLTMANSDTFSQTVNVSTTTTFSLDSLVNDLGCVSTNVVDIIVEAPPTFNPSAVPTSVCSGSPIVITNGFGNASTITYRWNGGAVLTAVVQSGSATVPTTGVPAGPSNMLSIQSVTSSAGCVLNPSSTQTVNVLAAPVASIVSNSSLADGNNAYCVGQELSFSTMNTSSSYAWSMPAGSTPNGPTNAANLSISVSTSMNGYLVLSQTTGNMIASCTSRDSILISATRNMCEMVDIYQFPGNIFIAVLDPAVTTSTPYFEWLRGQPGVFVPGDDHDAIIIFQPSDVPNFLSVSGSYYGNNICECTSGFLAPEDLENDILKELLLYPNPVEDGRFQLILPSYFADQELTARLFDLQGALVFERPLPPGTLYRSVDLPAGMHGIYHLELRSALHVSTTKLIVR